jgi:hypothetical protein
VGTSESRYLSPFSHPTSPPIEQACFGPRAKRSLCYQTVAASRGCFAHRVVTGALESVLYVDDLGLAIANEYPHHVEAQRLEEVRSPILEVLPSQRANRG